jgi:hypothetical protein
LGFARNAKQRPLRRCHRQATAARRGPARPDLPQSGRLVRLGHDGDQVRERVAVELLPEKSASGRAKGFLDLLTSRYLSQPFGTHYSRPARLSRSGSSGKRTPHFLRFAGRFKRPAKIVSVACRPPDTMQTSSPRTCLTKAAVSIAPLRQIDIAPIRNRLGWISSRRGVNSLSICSQSPNRSVVLRRSALLPFQLLLPRAPVPTAAASAARRHALKRLAGSALESAISPARPSTN